VQGHRH